MSSKTSSALYEKHDAESRYVLLFLIFLFLGLLTCMGLVFWLFKGMKDQAEKNARPSFYFVSTSKETPSPMLQLHPSREYTELKAAMDRQLSTYGWVDKKKGLARIPIDAAISQLAREGLPARNLAKKEENP